MRQVILDTETTGLRVEDNHRLIELGCLEMINRKLTGVRFHFYINPEREVDAGAFAVHGISNEFLKDKLLFTDIAQDFIDFISDAELIIHNAPFDTSFINHELTLTSRGFKRLADYCQIVDTLAMARQLHVGQRNSLDALCKRYNVDNSKRDFHGALLDAYLLAQVYLAMTGGQGSFFDSLAEAKHQNKKNVKANINKIGENYNLHVLLADPAEKDAHEQYLQRMQQKGKCLWLDD